MENYWYPIALAKELKKAPKCYYLLNQKIVVYRSPHGIVAQKDSCPHRKFPLSAGKIVNGRLQCGYHGWEFDDKGFLTEVPGMGTQLNSKCSMLNTYSAQEYEDLIWVCLEENVAFKPYQKDLLKDRKLYSFKTTIIGDTADILENFLDPLHTAFLHDGIIRSKGKRNLTHAEIRAIPHGVEAKYTEESNQTGLIGNLFGRNITHSFGRLTKGNIIDLEFHSKNGIDMTNRFIIVPTQGDENLFFSQITFRKTFLPIWFKYAVVSPFFYIALQQDKKGIKQQLDNKHHFKEDKLRSTYLDIMKPYIDRMLNQEELKVIEKDIEMHL
ncbi:MAG: Rieske (2Fe-2S) protein [Aureispira sp.]|nr:Rieske (2Fe-2S) protein [Aureispira sp.]